MTSYPLMTSHYVLSSCKHITKTPIKRSNISLKISPIISLSQTLYRSAVDVGASANVMLNAILNAGLDIGSFDQSLSFFRPNRLLHAMTVIVLTLDIIVTLLFIGIV